MTSDPKLRDAMLDAYRDRTEKQEAKIKELKRLIGLDRYTSPPDT